MIIPYYVRCIREGIELAGIDTNFVLLSERYLYGDYLFEDGSRVFQDVYRKPISPEFRSFNIKAGLDDKEKEILNLPSEFDPIVLLTKGSTVKIAQSSFRYGELKKEYLEFIKNLTPEEFGKFSIINAFHEASHRKYPVDLRAYFYTFNDVKKKLRKFSFSNDEIGVLKKSDFFEYVPEFGRYVFRRTTLSELPVILDELRLSKRRPDLEPYVTVRYEGFLVKDYTRAYQLAKKLIGS